MHSALKSFSKLNSVFSSNKAKIALFCSLTYLSIGSAVAQVAASNSAFDLALNRAEDAVESYGPALVGLAAVGVVFMIAIKYVKKIPGSS